MKPIIFLSILILTFFNISCTDSKTTFTSHQKKENAENYLVLGKQYFHGHKVEKSYKEAYSYFTQAGSNGEPLGYLYAGYMHYSGLGVEHSTEKANYFYELAVKQSCLEAKYQLALNKNFAYGKILS